MRKAKQKAKSYIRPGYTGGYLAGPEGVMTFGDEYTIAGIRMYPDGSFTTKCKPGNETKFIYVPYDHFANAQLRDLTPKRD